jgi:chemotaxis protein MotB
MISALSRSTNRDRWLLSYADFITVLFAVFVLMFVSARAKDRSSTSLPAPAAEPAMPLPPVQRQSNLLTDLQNALSIEQQTGVVTLSVDDRGVVIALDDKLCFQPGRADIEPAAVPMFAKLAQILGQRGNRLLLEGHTDSMPIHNAQFRSNWELSTARSIAVMELMQEEANIPGQRFLIGGSADNAPVSSNSTEQGRAHNRRVEIVVIESVAPESVEAQHPAPVRQ